MPVTLESLMHILKGVDMSWSRLRRRLRLLVFLGMALTVLMGAWIQVQAAPVRESSSFSVGQRTTKPALPCFPLEQLPKEALAPPLPANEGPLSVDVHLHVDEVPVIASTEDNYTLVGFLDVGWCDPRLAASLDPQEKRRVLTNEGASDFMNSVWNPQITFTNEEGEAIGDDLTLTIDRDGRVELQRRMQVTLASNFDVRRFPFDRQLLEGDIASFSWDSRIVRLLDNKDNVTISRSFEIPDWDIIGASSKVIEYDDPDHGDDTFSLLKFNLEVARKSAFYLNKIFIPLAVLSFTSIFFLAIPLDSIGDRIQFVSSLLFTTLAYQLIIASSVPRVPYFTLGDKYTLFLFFFMVVEVFIAYAISLVHRFGDVEHKLVNRYELGFEIVLPLIFLIVNIYFYSQAV
jgi:hypothetical protein